MSRFILRRVLWLIPVLVFVSLITFTLMHITPGGPWDKEKAYKLFIVPEPVQYAGFKLFYKNDKPMMSPERVLELWPSPVYIQYQ